MPRKPRRVPREHLESYEGQRGWKWRGDYWVAECCIVGCSNLIGLGRPICVDCETADGEGFDVEWWVWFWRDPSAERKQMLLEAHYHDDAFEVLL